MRISSAGGAERIFIYINASIITAVGRTIVAKGPPAISDLVPTTVISPIF